jgi:hypothetical protein
MAKAHKPKTPRGKAPRRKTPRAGKTAKPSRGRAEVPDPATVIATKTFTSPKGKRYTILETTQMDPYDRAPNSGKRRRPH